MINISDVFEGLKCMDGPYHIELDEAVKIYTGFPDQQVKAKC